MPEDYEAIGEVCYADGNRALKGSGRLIVDSFRKVYCDFLLKLSLSVFILLSF